MNNVVERCLSTFGMMKNLTEDALAGHRIELSSYIAKLHAAGEEDEHRLAVHGLTFLRQTAELSEATRPHA